MSPSDNGPDDARKERYRRGVSFLQRARDMPELSAAQIDRIERHLNRSHPRAGRRSLSPAMAALIMIVLGGGAALAVAGRDLARLPIIGPWVGALFTTTSVRSGPATSVRPGPSSASAGAATTLIPVVEAPPPSKLMAAAPVPPGRAAASPSTENSNLGAGAQPGAGAQGETAVGKRDRLRVASVVAPPFIGGPGSWFCPTRRAGPEEGSSPTAAAGTPDHAGSHAPGSPLSSPLTEVASGSPQPASGSAGTGNLPRLGPGTSPRLRPGVRRPGALLTPRYRLSPRLRPAGRPRLRPAGRRLSPRLRRRAGLWRRAGRSGGRWSTGIGLTTGRRRWPRSTCTSGDFHTASSVWRRTCCAPRFSSRVGKNARRWRCSTRCRSPVSRGRASCEPCAASCASCSAAVPRAEPTSAPFSTRGPRTCWRSARAAP